MLCDWRRETMIIYQKNVVCECYVWIEGGDESGQARLLILGKILGRRMRELELSSL
jgi:hypothetical protein